MCLLESSTMMILYVDDMLNHLPHTLMKIFESQGEMWAVFGEKFDSNISYDSNMLAEIK